MSRVFIRGLGAVSPAGWGAAALREALEEKIPLPEKPLARPGWEKPLLVRQAPPPATRPGFLAHNRLRRASPIAQHTVAATLEALGDDAAQVAGGSLRLGIIVCVMAGSVNYSRRFYEETLNNPATASPLVFPETVFNAPASHLAAFLGTTAESFTLVGDDGVFLQGIALAADWLLNGKVDGCVVVGAEEMDWIVADAMRLFQRRAVHGEGAGALYLRTGTAPVPGVELSIVTDSFVFTGRQNRREAARRMRTQLPNRGPNELLCLGTQDLPGADAAETAAWRDWTGTRLAPKTILGEAFTASAAWQCVAACDAVERGKFAAANVSVVGANQQAIGARFTISNSEPIP